MNDDLDGLAVSREDFAKRIGVADVYGVMRVTLERTFKLLSGVGGGGRRTEEPRAQIIVNTDDIETLLMKPFGGFRANETGRTGDKCDGYYFGFPLSFGDNKGVHRRFKSVC